MSMQKNKMDQLKQLIRQQAAAYLDDENINSVGLAYKTVNGEPTDELVVEFTVDKKMQPEQLESLNTQMIPSAFDMAGMTIETNVVQRSYKPAFLLVPQQVTSSRKDRFEVMQPGISISNYKGTAGTIGCFVTDPQNGIKYILSNWHVLEGVKGEIGDKIVQPGPYDDNNWQPNVIGALHRSHLGLAGDCAISTISHRGVDNTIFGLDVAPAQIAKAELGDHVVKSGRTTSITHGIVSKVEMIVDLNYGGQVGSRQIGGFEIKPDPNFPAHNNEISMGGDSGSCWVIANKDGKPTDVIVGLHFAGESSSAVPEFALACNIHSVLSKLKVKL